MSDDIQSAIVIDVSGVTSAMTESRDQLDQTITTIQRQETSWKSFSVTAIESAARISGPIISLVAANQRLAAATLTMGAANATAAPPTFTLGAAVNFLLSPIVLTLAAITLLAAAVYYFSGAGEEAAATTRKLGGEASDAANSLSALESIQESFAAGFIGTKGIEELESLGEAGKELKKSFGELSDALVQPLRDAGFEVGSAAELMTGFTSKIRLATEAVKSLTSITGNLTEYFKDAAAQATLMATMLATGMNADDAGAMIAAREAERVGTIEAFQALKAEKFAVEELEAIMKNATGEAEKRGRVSRISSITSLEGLDAETKALETQIASLKQKRKYNEDAKKDAEELAKAIANQREGIESGKVKEKENPVEASIRQAEQAVRKLQIGEIDAAVAMALLNDASDEQAERLRKVLTEQELLNAAKVAAKEAERAAKEAAEKAMRTNEQAESQLTKMRDELDLLTGSATKAEIAMREMARQGFSDEQILAGGEMAKQLDELKEKKDQQSKNASTAFAAIGSKEAYSTIVKAMGGGRDKDAEIAANTRRMAELQERTIAVLDERNTDERTAWAMDKA